MSRCPSPNRPVYQSLYTVRALGLGALLATALAGSGCGGKHAGTNLSETEVTTPDAQPCGDGCPEGTTCVPTVDEDGNPVFKCIDVHIRLCAPCLEDADCNDSLMPDTHSICRPQQDGSGSFCATDCSKHSDCAADDYCSGNDGCVACGAHMYRLKASDEGCVRCTQKDWTLTLRRQRCTQTPTS